MYYLKKISYYINMEDNPYKILGISENATQGEIKKAYYKLAKKYHPDKNICDETAQDKFKRINTSYEILKNNKNRINYDNMSEKDKRKIFYRNLKSQLQTIFPEQTGMLTQFIENYYSSGEDLFMDLLNKDYNKISNTFQRKIIDQIKNNT